MELKIAVVSGRFLDLNTLQASDINAWDIIWASRNIIRYNGQIPESWDVMNHSIFAQLLYLEKEREIGNKFTRSECLNAVAILLHDAAESYIGDIIQPLKRNAEFAFFHELEYKVLRTIFEAFEIEYDDVDWVMVKKYDKAATHTEFAKFFPMFGENFLRAYGDPEVDVKDFNAMVQFNPVACANILQARLKQLCDLENRVFNGDIFQVPETLKSQIKTFF